MQPKARYRPSNGQNSPDPFEEIDANVALYPSYDYGKELQQANYPQADSDLYAKDYYVDELPQNLDDYYYEQLPANTQSNKNNFETKLVAYDDASEDYGNYDYTGDYPNSNKLPPVHLDSYVSRSSGHYGHSSDKGMMGLLGTVDICPDVLMALLATFGAAAFLALRSAISAAAMTRRRRRNMAMRRAGAVTSSENGVWPLGNEKALPPP